NDADEDTAPDDQSQTVNMGNYNVDSLEETTLSGY
ncbi:MAG: hypothetical protein J07HQX50_01732, partial [Haloquadratum sp. J07HQX50]